MAKNNQGHAICAKRKNSAGIPTISIINTYFNDLTESNLLYDYDNEASNIYGTGRIANWQNCSSNLCTESPFTGVCTAVDISNTKLGMLCNYNPNLLQSFPCPPNTNILANVISSTPTEIPSITSCINQWNCDANTNNGTFNRSTDCTISSNNHVDVAGKLEIIGATKSNDFVTITASFNSRHFYVHDGGILKLYYLKLVGGDVTSKTNSDSTGGSIYVDNNAVLYMYSSTLYNNKAASGSGIEADNGEVNIDSCSIIKNFATVI